jgi:hypothetical protein
MPYLQKKKNYWEDDYMDENKIPGNCLDCENHEVIPDPDPHDWFNDDDLAVVCKITVNDSQDPGSKYCSDRQEFKCITRSCRPYNDRKESGRPSWCPLINK